MLSFFKKHLFYLFSTTIGWLVFYTVCIYGFVIRTTIQKKNKGAVSRNFRPCFWSTFEMQWTSKNGFTKYFGFANICIYKKTCVQRWHPLKKMIKVILNLILCCRKLRVRLVFDWSKIEFKNLVTLAKLYNTNTDSALSRTALKNPQLWISLRFSRRCQICYFLE